MIVADIHGVLPLFQRSIVSTMDARDRFLKPGGRILLFRDTLWISVISTMAHQEAVEAWNTEHGFDLSGARLRAANQPRRRRFEASDLIAAPQSWATLDYRTIAGPNVSGEVTCVVDRAAIGHGLAGWFDRETAPGIGFSNSPASSEHHVFSQVFFPWPGAVPLASGDVVRVRLRLTW